MISRRCFPTHQWPTNMYLFLGLSHCCVLDLWTNKPTVFHDLLYITPYTEPAYSFPVLLIHFQPNKGKNKIIFSTKSNLLCDTNSRGRINSDEFKDQICIMLTAKTLVAVSLIISALEHFLQNKTIP